VTQDEGKTLIVVVARIVTKQSPITKHI